jgi:hypothetical protein
MKKTLVLLAFIFGIFGVFSLNVSAQTNTAYTIQKIPSGSEINEQASFFDLKLAPGQKQTIQTLIRNTSAEEILVVNQVFTAFTNENGEIDYTRQAESYDSSLQVRMSDIAKVKASDIQTLIPAGEERIVSVDIQMPENVQDGVLLGSWHFQEKEQEAENTASEGVVINSQYAYALAIKITVDSEVSAPNLNLLGITSGMVNYRKAFLAQLQNNLPALLTRVRIEGRVTARNSFDTLYEHTMERVAFAPNSNFDFPVFLGEDRLKAGEYTYRIRAVTEDIKEGFTGRTWEWNQDFTVLPEEAARVNSAAINDGIPPTRSLLDYLSEYWWQAILALCLLFFFFILLFKRRKKEKEKEEEKIQQEALKLVSEFLQAEKGS